MGWLGGGWLGGGWLLVVGCWVWIIGFDNRGFHIAKFYKMVPSPYAITKTAFGSCKQSGENVRLHSDKTAATVTRNARQKLVMRKTTSCNE